MVPSLSYANLGKSPNLIVPHLSLMYNEGNNSIYHMVIVSIKWVNTYKSLYNIQAIINKWGKDI